MTAAEEYRSPQLPERLPRLLGGLHADDRAVSLADHVRRLGLPRPPRDLISLVEQSGLRGRGGAGFPTAQKLAAVAAQRQRPVVVANAAEGEPASGKDKALLRHNPHLVLDGAAIAAAALGAREAVIAISSEAVEEQRRVGEALEERRRHHIDSVALRVAVVPQAFVSGEETALLNAIAGRPAKPTVKPPFPFERGLGGRPTLVQNAETLAHLALIARFGPTWFRDAGADDAPGTALVTLSGTVARPGVHEIELGTTLADLLLRGGGATEPLSAFLVGGYFGGFVSAGDAETMRLMPENLGAGAIVAFPAEACAVSECARVLRFLADESAGQCGPCVHGLAAIADGFAGLVRGERGGNTERLARWSEQIRGRGACRHPDGAARFITSALGTFDRELQHHARHGRCRERSRTILPLPRSRS